MFAGHGWILLVLVLALILIIFGPGQLSKLGHALGQAMRDFRRSSGEPDGQDPKKR